MAFFRRVKESMATYVNLPIINHQGYYDAIAGSTEGLVVAAKFSQGGSGIPLTGYLPAAGGACAFTTLDFFRAGTQNCMDEWLNHTRSTIWTSQHAERQAYLYRYRRECSNDPLFKLTLTNPPADRGFMARESLLEEKEISAKIAERIFLIYNTFLDAHEKNPLKVASTPIPLSIYAPCLEFTFNIQLKGQNEKHTTGFILEPPGEQKTPTLLYMDPNTGVIRVPLKIPAIHEALQAVEKKAYLHFSISNIQIDQKMQRWIENVAPILTKQTRTMEQEIHGVGSIGFKTRALDYKSRREAALKQEDEDTKAVTTLTVDVDLEDDELGEGSTHHAIDNLLSPTAIHDNASESSSPNSKSTLSAASELSSPKSPVSVSSTSSDSAPAPASASPSASPPGASPSASNDPRFTSLFFESKSRPDSASTAPASRDESGPLYYDFNPLAEEANRVKMISLARAVPDKDNDENDEDYVLVK